jgi:hypothetical protein
MKALVDSLNAKIKNSSSSVKMAWRDGLNFYAYFSGGIVSISDYHAVKKEAQKLLPECEIFLNCL